jgi:NAD(P)-dependent dehydrogenase (short-subunit alcohol dehydrogenase family)
MGSLKDKVIAITGAASGIGLETARVCAERGARLALSDVQPDALKRSIAELKAAFPTAEIIGTGVDISDHNSVNSWIAATVEHFGRLDGAANIAGMGGQKVFCNVEDEENENWDAIIRVNLTGTFYCVRAQLGVMKRGASIVNCASTTAFMGRPGIGAYSVSKHGIVGLTKAVAKEVGGKGIRVNAVAPWVARA